MLIDYEMKNPIFNSPLHRLPKYAHEKMWVEMRGQFESWEHFREFCQRERRAGREVRNNEGDEVGSKRKFAVTPGTIGSLALAQDLLGVEAIVDPGEFATPFVIECTVDDAQAFKDLLQNRINEINADEAYVRRCGKFHNVELQRVYR